MPKLLDMMFLNHCPHEFSWPRRLQTGECYQVCLLCGDQYGYDWKKMRRLDRIAVPMNASDEPPAETKAKWLPRARRLHLNIPIRYRMVGAPAWHDGEIHNISESGVFIAGAEALPEKTLLEMLFEMPVQISGKKQRAVLCNGRIARMKTREGDSKHVFAVAIMACQYLHDDMPTIDPSSKKLNSIAAAAMLKSIRCRSQRRT